MTCMLFSRARRKRSFTGEVVGDEENIREVIEIGGKRVFVSACPILNSYFFGPSMKRKQENPAPGTLLP